MELSRLSKFLIDRGALKEAELSSTNYRQLPLVQGGLEISCIIRIKMLSTRKNKELLARYKKIYDENYSEAEELVMGSFLAPVLTSSSTPSSSKRTLPASSASKSTETKAKNRDIRTFFNVGNRIEERESEDNNYIITID